MTNREGVLARLVAAKGTYVSGATMAQELKISRAAVGKIVNKLQGEGYAIQAVTNRGYCLEDGWDESTVEGIVSRLDAEDFYCVSLFDSLPSTNAYLKGLTQAQEGQVVLAGTQTAGYGRFGRHFYSPEHSGIYISMLLKPSSEQLPFLTALAGVAVCRALKEMGFDPTIKWVNDIWLGGKKVCGILSEVSFSLENPGMAQVVLGIGLNLYRPQGGFPKELEDIACGATPQMVPGGKDRLTAEILNQIHRLYRNFDLVTLAQDYKGYSGILGRAIRIHRGAEEIPARAVDIDQHCHLVVVYPDGGQETLQAGEISLTMEESV